MRQLFARVPSAQIGVSRYPARSTTALVRSAQVSAANPVGRSTIVIQRSTGHTSEHRLQPTHSVSSTRGIRSRVVGYGPTCPLGGSSFGKLDPPRVHVGPYPT